MKYRILPIFIPQYACPYRCIFCDQKIISGEKQDFTFDRIKKQIIKGIETNKGNEVELAFYGGNFTAIPKEIQKAYLELACSFEEIKSIRISTRPDCIDEDILSFLKDYNVKTIEIGIQSMFDDVLKVSNRGHSSADNIKAMILIKQNGFLLGAQIMVGLPQSNAEKDIKTAKIVSYYKPDFARIYPTLVIKNTPLEILYKKHIYRPLDLDEAILVCATIKQIFMESNIDVIRVGLQPTEEINYNAEVVAGPFHPAFGELVDSEIIFRKIISNMDKSEDIKSVDFFVPSRLYSKFVGNKKRNIKRLSEIYKNIDINIFLKQENQNILTIKQNGKEYFIDMKKI